MKLTVKDSEFFYNKARTAGFTDISFTLDTGDFMCILGPNGCGKTTLLKSINSLIKPARGKMEIDGRDMSEMSQPEIARAIGYVPQLHQPAFPFTVLEVVLMGRAPHLGLFSSPTHCDIAIADEAINTMGIMAMRDKPYTQLSGGERQLVVFARVLAQKPSIILLDEPTSHLDFGNQVRLLTIVERLASTGIPIIMTSHFPDHAFMVSNKVMLMKNGRIVDMGAPDEVVTENNLNNVYDMRVKIINIDSDINRKICLPVGEKILAS